jgi:type II secretory pathway pseudopilin PulG
MRHKGFLMAEMVTATVLLGLIVVGLAVSTSGFSKFNQYQWERQRCTAAALAQLESVTAAGVLVEPQELKRLWPEVKVSVERTPADSPWDGLELVQVTAASRQVTVRLARYVAPKPAIAKGGLP